MGPAGKLLDKALEEAEIDRSKVYMTNVVKHFKWEPRGKLRIHKKPTMKENHACSPWLDAELKTLHPTLVVALGATAAQALLGSSFGLHGHTERCRKCGGCRRSLPHFTRRRYCGRRRMRIGTAKCNCLLRIYAKQRGSAEKPIKATTSNLDFSRRSASTLR